MFLGAAGAAAGGATAAAVGAGELHKTLTFSSLKYLFQKKFLQNSSLFLPFFVIRYFSTGPMAMAYMMIAALLAKG